MAIVSNHNGAYNSLSPDGHEEKPISYRKLLVNDEFWRIVGCFIAENFLPERYNLLPMFQIIEFDDFNGISIHVLTWTMLSWPQHYNGFRKKRIGGTLFDQIHIAICPRHRRQQGKIRSFLNSV
jgi:hypothetical protein